MTGRPPGPWHTVYQPLDDPAAETFVWSALDDVRREFGEPVVPVNEILLRRSRKSEGARRYPIAQDFTLTECDDPTNGLFVIYIAVGSKHKNYYPLLGHECAHLYNPYIIDWYMEGMATVFSEEVCREAGLEWGDWTRKFARDKRQPYPLSYRMMRDLKRALPSDYPTIVQYAVPVDGNQKRLRVDIDAWLATLSTEDERAALEIISKYADKLKKHATGDYSFTIPSALH